MGIHHGRRRELKAKQAEISDRFRVVTDLPHSRIVPRRAEPNPLAEGAELLTCSSISPSVEGIITGCLHLSQTGEALGEVIASGYVSRENPRREDMLREYETAFRAVAQSFRFLEAKRD